MGIMIIKYGQVIHNEDEGMQVRFEAKTMSEYFDTRPLRALYRQHLFEALAKGRFYD